MLDKASPDSESQQHEPLKRTHENKPVPFPGTDPDKLNNPAVIERTPPVVPAKRKKSMIVKLFFNTWRSAFQLALMAAVLFVSYIGMQMLIASKEPPKKRPYFQSFYTIKTIVAKPQDHQPLFVSYGQIEAARSVDLRSLVSGEVISINPTLRVGATIEAGQPLVEIDKFNYLGALSEAKANLLQTEAAILENEARIASEKAKLDSAAEQLLLARKDLARAQSLRKRKTITQKQFEDRSLVVSQRQQAQTQIKNAVKIEEARLAGQKAGLERLKWRVQQAERNVENTVLKAPFSGVVSSTSVEVGKLVSANDIVVSLNEKGAFEAKFTLTDAQFGRLQNSDKGIIGREVEVIWAIGGREKLYKGAIERIGAEITSNRGGVEVFAVLNDAPDQASIRPGAFVEVRGPDQIFKDIIKIPETSVYNGSTAYVAVDGKLQKRDIRIAAFDGEDVLVESGLKPGDRILVTRIAEVSEGLNVREEGAPTPKRGPPKGQSQDQAKEQPLVQGDAARDPARRAKVIAAIKKSNNISDAQWDAMSRPERRKLFRAHRAKQGG